MLLHPLPHNSDLPPDTSTNDILRMRFLDTNNMSNIEAKATHFIELCVSITVHAWGQLSVWTDSHVDLTLK